MWFLFIRKYLIKKIEKTALYEIKKVVDPLSKLSRFVNNPQAYVSKKVKTYVRYSKTLSLYNEFNKFLEDPNYFIKQKINSPLDNFKEEILEKKTDIKNLKFIFTNKDIEIKWIHIKSSESIEKLSYNYDLQKLFLEFKKTPNIIYVFYLSRKMFAYWVLKGLNGSVMWKLWYRKQVNVKAINKVRVFDKNKTFNSPILAIIGRQNIIRYKANNPTVNRLQRYGKSIKHQERIRYFSPTRNKDIVNIMYQKVNRRYN